MSNPRTLRPARLAMPLALAAAALLAGCGEQSKIDPELTATLIQPVARVEIQAVTIAPGSRTGEQQSSEQAEEARTHAGNLAHALKTPLTVLTNAANAQRSELGETVLREAATMRRQVDHHLARARAVGRRATGTARHAGP